MANHETTSEGSENKLNLGKLGPGAGALGALGTIVLVALMATGNHDVWGSYLFGLMFWLSVTLGMFGLSLLHHTVRGSWSSSILRLLDAGGGANSLALMAAFMVPIAIFPGQLYEWAHPEVVTGDRILEHKAPFLNQTAFIVVSAIFFGIWIALAAFMRKSTLRQEENKDFKLEAGRSSWGAVGMVVFMLTVTFALTLWLMSLNPHWYSTMYGVWLTVASAGAALALCNLILCTNAHKWPYNTIVSPNLLKDLGNMQFVLTMLWGYTSISQFLIIWNGNIPETTSYFVQRSSAMHPPGMEGNHWGIIGLVLIVGRFFIPFFTLIAPRTKRFPENLKRIAGWILVMHIVDMYLIVQPSIHGRAEQGPFAGHILLDILAFVAVGGLWLAMFASQTRKAPLLLGYDTRLQEALHNAH